MVLPLFDGCAVFWDSCGQGSKSYWNKLNHLAACIIEGHAVNGQMNFLPYLADPICKHAVTSLNLSFSINVSPSYLLSEFRLAHQLHSHLTRQCDQLQLPLAKTTKYQGIFRITCNGTHAYNSLPSNIRAIKDFNKFKSLAKWYFKSQAAILWNLSIVVCLRTFSGLLSFHNSFVLTR